MLLDPAHIAGQLANHFVVRAVPLELDHDEVVRAVISGEDVDESEIATRYLTPQILQWRRPRKRFPSFNQQVFEVLLQGQREVTRWTDFSTGLGSGRQDVAMFLQMPEQNPERRVRPIDDLTNPARIVERERLRHARNPIDTGEPRALG